MKKGAKIVQWIFSVNFGLFALVNGFHWSSLLLLLAAILMMPIQAIRNTLNRFKLKNSLIVSLSVALFIVAALASPLSDENNVPNDTPPPYSDSTTDIYESGELSSGGESNTESSNNQDSGTNDSSNSNNSTNQGGSSNNSGSNNTGNNNNDSNSDNNNEGGNTGNSGNAGNTSTENPNDKIPDSVGNGTPEPVDPSTIPAYSDSPYIVINNNIPSFVKSELKTTGYELYSDLDSLGRCGVALASCGREIMPAEGEERGNISSIIPTGWIQASYAGVSGGYLWNRCHLIGWQLSAENANRKNLITGTRYMNVSGMLPFENMIADYIKETGNHVAFRVTPIFEGNNLVCSGVQLEAYSVEDCGEGIQFNVYCYNVQPGIAIDYATGQSHSNDSTNDNQPDDDNNTDDNTNNNPNNQTELVWIPSTGSKYHSSSTCSNMKEPMQVTKEEAIKQGYEPCKRCH